MQKGKITPVIGLLCQNRDFRNFLLCKLFKKYGCTDSTQRLQIQRGILEDELMDLLDKSSQDELKTWKIDLQGIPVLLASFITKIEFGHQEQKRESTEQEQPNSNIFLLLLEIKEKIEDETLGFLKTHLSTNSKLLLLVDKQFHSLPEVELTNYFNQILPVIIHNLPCQLPSQNIFSTCLDDESYELPKAIVQQLIQKEESAPQESQSLEDQVKREIFPLFQLFEISKKKECYELILTGKFQLAALQCPKRSKRKDFVGLLGKCQKLKQMLSIEKQQRTPDLKKQQKQLEQKFYPNEMPNILNQEDKVKQFLGNLFQRYGVTKKDDCLQYLLAKNIEDGLKKVPKAAREKFKENLLASEQYQLWLRPPVVEAQSSQICLELNNILKKYELYDLKKCQEALISRKISEAIKFVKPKDKILFERDLGKSQIFQLYLREEQKVKEEELKNNAKAAIQKILNEYQVQEPQNYVWQILDKNIEDIMEELTTQEQRSFQDQLQKNEALIEYYNFQARRNSIENPRSNQLLELKSKAVESLLTIFEEIQIQNASEYIPNILEKGDMTEIYDQLTSSQKKQFERRICECKEIQQFWKLQKQLQSSIGNLNTLKENAQQEVKQLLDNFTVKNKEKFLLHLWKGNFEDASKSIEKQKRKEFLIKVNKCQKLLQYLNCQNNKEEQKQTEQQRLARIQSVLANSIKKYSSRRADQCLKLLMSNNITEASKLITKAQRSRFAEQIENLKEFQQLVPTSGASNPFLNAAKKNIQKILHFYGIKQNNSEIESFFLKGSLEEAKNCLPSEVSAGILLEVQDSQEILTCLLMSTIHPFLKKEIQNQKLQSCLKQLLKGDFEQILNQALSDCREKLESEIKQNLLLNKYISNCSPQNLALKQARKALMRIFYSFGIKQPEDCWQQLQSMGVEQLKRHVRRQKRQQFLQKVSTCLQYQQYCQQKEPLDPVKTLIAQTQEEVKKILNKYQVKDLKECLEDALKGNFQDLKIYVVRGLRQSFVRQVKDCPSLIKYHSCQIEDIIAVEQAKKKVKGVLTTILNSFSILDVQSCLTLLYEGQIAEVLEEVRSNQKKDLENKLKSCQQYQQYLHLAFGSKKIGKIVDKCLNTLNISLSNKEEIVKGIEEGNFKLLKESIQIDGYFTIRKSIFENTDFLAYIEEHAYHFLHVPKLYLVASSCNFELSKINEHVEQLQLSIHSTPTSLEGKTWMDAFLKQIQSQRVAILTEEVEQLQFYAKSNPQQAQKISHLQEYLQIVIEQLIIFELKQLQKHLEELKTACGIFDFGQIKNKIEEMTIKLRQTKESSIRQRYQFEIDTIKKLESIMLTEKQFFRMLKVHSVFDLAKMYFSELSGERLTFKQVSNVLSVLKPAIDKLLYSNNQEQYHKQKIRELKFRLFNLFFEFNKQILHSLMTTLVFQNEDTAIMVNQQMQSCELYELVMKQLKMTDKNVILQLEYDSQKKLLKNEKTIIKKPAKINCYKTVLLACQMHEKLYKIAIAKFVTIEILKQLIVEKFIEHNFKIKAEQLALFGRFGQNANLVQLIYDIDTMEIKKGGAIRMLNIKVKINITVFYEVQSYNFSLESEQNIDDLKEMIYEKTNIAKKSQSIIYIKDEKEREVFDQSFKYLDPTATSLTFSLISKLNLEHYGFHENFQLKYQDYSQFFVQREEDVEAMIESCTLKSDNQRIFFNQLIKFLYAALKRRFVFSFVTDQVKQKIAVKKKQEIWAGGDFTCQFIMYYILYNAESKLRVELMNILRSYLPLPLYFKEFKNINDIRNEWTINSELLWLLHPGLYITSIGLHKHSKQQKGKSFLNNLIFFTNFQESAAKHPIAYGCPEICLKILDNIAPVNFIDIPSQTNEQIVNNILKCTHILLIHSWQNRKLTEQYVNELKDKYKIKFVICLERDTGLRDQSLSRILEANFLANSNLPIHKITQSSEQCKRSPFIRNLAQRIWTVVETAFNNKEYLNERSIYDLYNSPLFNQFESKTMKLASKFDQIKIVFDKYEKIKQLQRDKTIANADEITKLTEKAIANKIEPSFLKIIQLIDENKDQCQMLMLRFREKIKEIKNEKERIYTIIAAYKEKISDLIISNKNQVAPTYEQCKKEIEALPRIKKMKSKGTNEEIVEELSKVCDQVEDEIKPSYFSIESAWRQLQYLIMLDQHIKLGENELQNFVIDIRRKEMWNSQPFELLDGDLLEMPKLITKKIFQGMNDRVAVVTILGPQSSGKSTLLNFLFGCDFGTSSGRCTRGVYGTYFKFSNLRLPHCEGIFIIDTEGLFAHTNKKDEARRKDFDAKLVLFCLAVSDIVIINTKGNIDIESSKILKSSMERFSALTEENLEWPEVYLTLNQNNNSNINTSKADINKLRQLFSEKNSYALNQAYQLVELNKSDILMLPSNENLMKRQPRQQFLFETNKLQSSLLNKIETKSNFKPISVQIDLMEKIWNTIEAFPNLGKTLSKKAQQMQDQIKEWKLQQIQQLTTKKKELFSKFKDNALNEKKCQEQFEFCVKQKLIIFAQKFCSDEAMESMSEQEKIKVQLEEKKNQLAFETIKFELNFQIKDFQKHLLAEKSKHEGNEEVKKAIRQVQAKQRDENRELSLEQKKVYFERAYSKNLSKIQLISSPQKQIISFFERIYEFYANAANIVMVNNNKSKIDGSKMKSVGLPKAQWKLDMSGTYEQFSQSIKGKIFTYIGRESNSYIQFRKNPPTKILNEQSKTDAKLEYFNMRNYFHKIKLQNIYDISEYYLQCSLKKELLKAQIYNLEKEKKSSKNNLKKIFDEINQYLCYNYKIKMYSFDQFFRSYQYQNKFITWLFSSEPILSICRSQIYHSSQNYHFGYSQSSYSISNNITSNVSQDRSKKGNRHKKKGKNKMKVQAIAMDIQKCSSHHTGNQQDSLSQSQEDQKQQIIQKEANLKKSTQFIKVKHFNQKFLSVSHYTNFYDISKFLSKCLKESIKWKQIRQQVQSSSEFKSYKQQINKIIHKMLNQDLMILGINIECLDYYQKIVKDNSEKRFIFKRSGELKKFNEENDFFKELKKLSKFDETKIKQCLGKSIGRGSVSKIHRVELGSFFVQTFEVLPEYKHNRDLHTYISENSNEVFYNLESDTMKQFVFKELQKNRGFQRLFSNIDKIINKAPQVLTLNNITGIYIDVNRECIEFNNDLNQVSHKITLLFSGYVHLYAIYLTWKKFSDMAFREANKPYMDMVNNKEKQFQFFIKSTSNKENEKLESEVDRFLDFCFEHCKQIVADFKDKVNERKAADYKKTYRRAVIQQKIDNQCFNIASKEELRILYLTNPAKVIEDKYEALASHTIHQLVLQYKGFDKVVNLMADLKEALQALFNKMKLEKVTQDTIHMDIFSMKKKGIKEISIADNEVLDQINQIVMKYFLDLLINEERNSYTSIDFDLQIKKEFTGIKVFIEPKPHLQVLVKKLTEKGMSITKLLPFIDLLSKKLKSTIIKKEKQVEKEVGFLEDTLQEMALMTAEDQKKYRALIAVKICKEMCPGCQRICGREETHVDKHQCLYGHQMRALGGVKLSNGDASVIRCEDVELINIIEFNGRKMTWLQFKREWENRAEGSWIFDDLSSKKNKQLFLLAWDLCGKTICKINEMNWVQSNQVTQQKQQFTTGNIHWIFALDDSGSMQSGSKWPNLMTSFKAAIDQIKKMPNYQTTNKISILLQGSNCLISQENVTPNQVNNNIKPRFGGNNFADTFGKAYNIMTKNVGGAKINFAFMTDGGDSYPSSQVSQIKELKNKNPDKINYFGIEFQTSGPTMNLINKQLNGTNKIAYTGVQLTNAFVEIINRQIKS